MSRVFIQLDNNTNGGSIHDTAIAAARESHNGTLAIVRVDYDPVKETATASVVLTAEQLAIGRAAVAQRQAQ